MAVLLTRAFCLLSLIGLPVTGGLLAQEIAPLLRQGARAARHGRISQATSLYKQALQSQPENVEANFSYGSLLLQQHLDPESARQALQRVYDLNPQYNPQLAFRLGRARHLTGHFPEAIEMYEAAMRTLRNTVSVDDLYEDDGADLRSLDADHRFSASELILYCRKGVQECESAQALRTAPAAPAEITSLGPTVNTAASEYAPVVNDNGQMLLFAARREKADQLPAPGKPLPHENIFFALRDENGQWSAPKPVGKLNSKLHEAPLGLSPDGRSLYLYRDVNGGDVFVAKRATNGAWNTPQPLGKPVNSPYCEPSFCLSTDGRFAFFASDRPDGFGGLDLYVTMRQPDGSWSPAFNLGPSVNTPYDEDAPVITADNNTLYFASRGHNSMGGFDLFRSQIEGATWLEPVNLGPNINTPFDETYLTLAANEQEGFFASDRAAQGGKDLYAVRFGQLLPTDSIARVSETVAMLTEPAKPTPSAPGSVTPRDVPTSAEAGVVQFALSGKVIDGYSGQPLSTELVVINRATRQTVALSKTDPGSGRFRILLPSDGTPYALEIQRPDYMFYTRNLDVTNQLAAEADLHDIALSKLEAGKSLVLNNLYFDYSKATLSRRSLPELSRIKELLAANPELKVEIGGHTDNKGSTAYNQRLSELRAQAVVQFLRQNGVAAERLRAVGYGLRNPIASNDTEAGRQQNRRTELKILDN